MANYNIEVHFEYKSEASAEKLAADLEQYVSNWPGSSNVEIAVNELIDD